MPKFKIPILPLSALIFYFVALILLNLGIIPDPPAILAFLERLYESYGLFGLFIASFLEGIVYFGLYFAGSFIVALAIMLSDGSFQSFLAISLVVATALTITSIINYVIGRSISARRRKTEIKPDKKILSKGLLFSMIHPNTLAFYFFNSGIQKHNALKVLLVPLIMIPYGFALANLIYLFKDSLRRAVENPHVLLSLILLWIIIAFLLENRNQTR